MIFFLIFMATMVVTGIPTALLFIPWCALTGNVLPLYKGTRFMLAPVAVWPGCASMLKDSTVSRKTGRASLWPTTFLTWTHQR